MGKDQVKKLRTAGLLHDIGKIGIDDNILNKREHLLESEWNDIKRHSEIGYRILSSVNEFSEIAESVLQHQEKWNGTGYPKGLKDIQISTEARIIAIADAYDAMTGVRPYGSVLSKEEALQEIQRCEGTHFDPQLAERFIDMVKSG
jgi:putative nucleotidyltransferase with HDIG domain